MKQGNFSEVAPIYDPFTTATVNGVTTRAAIPGQYHPEDRFSKISNNILPFIPAPTSAGNHNKLQLHPDNETDDYVWSLKVDHSIHENQRVSYFMTPRKPGGDFGPVLARSVKQRLDPVPEAGQLSRKHDWVIKPTILLHTTFGFTRQQQQWDNPLQKGVRLQDRVCR